MAGTGGLALTMGRARADGGDDTVDIDIDVEPRSSAWLDRRLQSHYDADWRRPPERGIYWLGTDDPLLVPTDRAALLARARAYADTLRPAERRFDCGDIALALRHRFVSATPGLAVGVAFARTANHVFNVFVVDGAVVEFEPQTGTVVTDERGRWQFDEGVLLL